MADKNRWCCGLISLGTGTIIIGVACTTFNLLEITAAAVKLNPYWNLTDVRIWDEPVTNPQLILFLVLAICQAMCGIYLIYGAKEEKVWMVLPWLIMECIVTIVATVICIALIGQAKINLGLGFTFYVVLNVYFLLVVYNFYETLRVNKESLTAEEEE